LTFVNSKKISFISGIDISNISTTITVSSTPLSLVLLDTVILESVSLPQR